MQRLLDCPPLPLTGHALQLHQQVQETGVTDGQVWLRVPQSDQLHYQIVHHDAWGRDMDTRRVRINLETFMVVKTSIYTCAHQLGGEAVSLRLKC